MSTLETKNENLSKLQKEIQLLEFKLEAFKKLLEDTNTFKKVLLGNLICVLIPSIINTLFAVFVSSGFFFYLVAITSYILTAIVVASKLEEERASVDEYREMKKKLKSKKKSEKELIYDIEISTKKIELGL